MSLEGILLNQQQPMTTRVPKFGMGKNLLKNYIFTSLGGSPKRFPINSHQQSTYTTTSPASIDTIDGWTLNRAESGSGSIQAALVIKDSVITIQGTDIAANPFIEQQFPIETVYFLRGKQVTATVWVDNTTIITGTVTIPTANSLIGQGNVSTILCQTDSLTIAYRQRESDLTYGAIRITVRTNYANITEYSLKGIKLELGTEQTFCYNAGTENAPNWLLCEVPNYLEILNDCPGPFLVWENPNPETAMPSQQGETINPIYLDLAGYNSILIDSCIVAGGSNKVQNVFLLTASETNYTITANLLLSSHTSESVSRAMWRVVTIKFDNDTAKYKISFNKGFSIPYGSASTRTEDRNAIIPQKIYAIRL